MLRSPRFCYTKTRSVLLILIELFLMMVPREDPFLLRLMDFRIGKNPWTDGPALEIYEVFRIDQLIWLRFRAYFECLAHLTNSPKPPDE